MRAGAAVRTWDGGDANWATPGNWDPNGYSNSDDRSVLAHTLSFLRQAAWGKFRLLMVSVPS